MADISSCEGQVERKRVGHHVTGRFPFPVCILHLFPFTLALVGFHLALDSGQELRVKIGAHSYCAFSIVLNVLFLYVLNLTAIPTL